MGTLWLPTDSAVKVRAGSSCCSTLQAMQWSLLDPLRWCTETSQDFIGHFYRNSCGFSHSNGFAHDNLYSGYTFGVLDSLCFSPQMLMSVQAATATTVVDCVSIQKAPSIVRAVLTSDLMATEEHASLNVAVTYSWTLAA